MSVSVRSTRLHRVPHLAGFRATLVELVRTLEPASVGHAFVLVPSRAAGEQLRRTIEDASLDRLGASMLFPPMGPREDWYAALASRLRPMPRLLTGFEREVMLAAAARAAADAGTPPPFHVRPGLIAEMMALYDHVHRLGRTVDDFERNFELELEKGIDVDRGAERLLQQTRFLVAAFRDYAARVEASGALDEALLRQRLLAGPVAQPLAHAIVALADRVADPDGLWPADFDLLTRLDGLLTIDIVCTEGALASGLLERLRAALPGIDERQVSVAADLPTLEAPQPAGDRQATHVFISRDREEELAAVARRLKSDMGGRVPLARIALVVRRPLPYLYLAREVFGSAGIPFETLDTLPLAAEPYAAAVDLAMNAALADFSRRSLTALLRAPQFAFGVELGAIAALDAALADARFQGGIERLETLEREWASLGAPANRDERRRVNALPALRAALEAARQLIPLANATRAIDRIGALLAFLRQRDAAAAERPHDRAEAESAGFDADDIAAREQRVRAAVVGAIAALGEAYRRHDPDADVDLVTLAAAVRRWLGARTFALRTGTPGVQIVDAQAARFGVFDDVQLMGLVNGEWPEPPRRNVLYPASLMMLLEPAPTTPVDTVRREREVIEAARASFRDLLALARRRVRVSSFLLESDAIVESSALVDEIPLAGLPVAHAPAAPPGRVFLHEAMALHPPALHALPARAARWACARLEDRGAAGRFQGEAGAWMMPRISVSRLERYLDCPFRFYASEVLRLEEEPEDEDTRTPLERGRFLHELFEEFFTEWQRQGRRRITPESLPEARSLFETICERHLATLPPAEAALERTRLLGSAVSAGIAHRVLAMEAERSVEVSERLLEYALQGDFTVRAEGRTRTVRLSAKADRIDLLADGTMRVIDYKSKLTPDVKQALQLPIYSFCARERLRGHDGRDWRLSEALYLSFEGERAVAPLRARGRSLEELVDEAQARMLETLDRIEAGSFPPSPARKSLCNACPYSAVCRLERVEAAE